jgi:hypothetical protein
LTLKLTKAGRRLLRHAPSASLTFLQTIPGPTGKAVRHQTKITVRRKA